MIFILWLVFGIITAIIANTKGRNVVGWFFVGFLGGLIGLIIVLCMSNLKEQRSKELAEQRERVRLREQLLQEKLKNEAFRRHTSTRLDAHDSALQLDTRRTDPLGALEARDLSKPILQSSDETSQCLEQMSQTTFGQQPVQMQASQTAQIPPVTPSTRLWHYLIDRDQMGPVPEQELIELFRMKYLNHETLVWSPGYKDWVKAGLIQNFAQVL